MSLGGMWESQAGGVGHYLLRPLVSLVLLVVGHYLLRPLVSLVLLVVDFQGSEGLPGLPFLARME